ncbi:Translocated intimin receptor (Tir) C-terminus [Flexibacter flexilis DSM 6793]|uniref:Translocated intimin receptor (Tir) C-terminus n=1 Tax=Flexibacter flexilis DSM 6793 TaxID=927664 RepID=A0A1I1DNK0_9BACT|nr:hypothetical protein [Flexibacter flexilis]SFB75992.1 Translocated intimin receptor (Tir) C-terminus [Flexibacter flexilis DSM 6793]
MKKHALALGVLLSASGLVSAQTEKGTKMLGVGISYDSKNNNSSRIYDGVYTTYPILSLDTVTTTKNHNEQKVRNQEINLNLSAGYFIAKNLLVGGQVGLGYAHSADKRNYSVDYLKYNTTGYSNTTVKNTITTSSVGLFGRYYFPIKEGKWYAFGQLSGLYSFNKVKYTSDHTVHNSLFWTSDTSNVSFFSHEGGYTQKYKSTNLVVQADAGIAYFISPNFSVETSVLNVRYTKQKPHDFEGYDYDSGKPSQLEFWEYGAFLNLNLAVKYFFK